MSIPSDTPVLDARSLSFPADGGVLRGVDLAVGRGETVAVLGPAGSGKTVLLHCLTGRLTPGGGGVWADGKAFHLFGADQRRAFQRRTFGLVPQRTAFVPELTLLQNTALPLLFTGLARDAATARAALWLDRFELGEFADRRTGDLPAEALRRAGLARGLVTDPLILLADEPLAGLAEPDAATIIRMLLSIARSHGTSVLCFTRDAATADRFQRRIELSQGRSSQQPVSAAVAEASGASEQAPGRPVTAPKAVVVSVPLSGSAEAPQQPVGLAAGAPAPTPFTPPAAASSGAGPAAMSHTAPAAPVASAGAPRIGASPVAAPPRAPATSMRLSVSSPGSSAEKPVNVQASASAAAQTVLDRPPPESAPPGPARPPIPPTHPRSLGGLPLGAPSHLGPGHAQVTS
ncbi:MAG TPA: ATP-binding cassette domain-containing protein [Actinocrinis sp.]|nr:ATP-binding cassette domain-containing protein [Actinocrinis sp.]